MAHGDDDPIGGQARHVGVDGGLGVGVEVCGRLVEEEHVGVAQAGAGDREAGPLPGGQAEALVAEGGVEAAGDEVVQADGSQRLLQVCVGARRG